MLPGRFIGMDGYGALAAGQLMIGLAALLVVPFLAALLTRWFSHGSAVGGGLCWSRAAACSCWTTPWRKAAACSPAHGPDRRRHRPALGPDGCAGGQRGTGDKVGMATGIFNTVRVSADGGHRGAERCWPS